MLIEHNRTAHRRTFELPCGKVVELWRDKEFIGMSRLLGVDIQVFETRADWENFRGNGNFEYPESGIKQRTRRYWLEAELARTRKLEKEVKRLSQLVLQNAFEAACEWYYDPAEGFDNWCQKYGAAALGVQNDNRQP